jgi:hypothetical protein
VNLHLRLRYIVPLAALAALGVSCWAMARWEHGFAHSLGIDTQQSQNYDFVSGVGPMVVAMVGYVSLFASLVHSVNCHEQGCWRVGRHKVDGSPWCNRHHGNARPHQSDNELLAQLLAELRGVRERL